MIEDAVLGSVSSLEYIDDVLGGVRMTSALTTPTTCFTVPRIGVTMTGASFKRSLAKLPVVMYEFLHAVIPDPTTGQDTAKQR